MTKRKKDKRTNNDLQNITQKPKDRVTHKTIECMLGKDDNVIYNNSSNLKLLDFSIIN